MNYPKTAGAMLCAIEKAGRIHRWHVATIPAERDDDSETRIAFWLTGADRELAYVAHEYGTLIVTLNGWYHFELDRLHQDTGRGWSWQQQIERKAWCTAAHLALLDELCEVIPPPPATARKAPAPSRQGTHA